ncbi:MAG: hypothetical protein LBD18_04835 [Treponema sp.]|jgi:hypothetical protein|nr:hypothetical protein [Treponema sp.]
MKTRIIFAATAVALIFAGCNSSPQPSTGVVNGGFPVIDIVDGNLSLSDDSRFASEHTGWVRSARTRFIGGTLNSPIKAKDIIIRLVDTSFQAPIKEGEDLSAWFVNMPEGLTATAHVPEGGSKLAAEKGAAQVLVTIEGTPRQTVNQPIKVIIPYEKTNRVWDFLIPVNEDLRFEVYGAVVADIIVGGAVNRNIDAKTFTIKFSGAGLTGALAQFTDISLWFTNLPNGLQAIVAENTVPVTEGQQSLLVTISGTPTVQSQEKMRIVIPQNITTANIALEIPPTDSTKYDIGSYRITTGSDIELRTGSNWAGAATEWALNGPKVFDRKDFTAVGIIQITAQAEYKIGDDGNFHWTGDEITYGKFMAEARRMNAHAIIDVVIDKDDVVDRIIEVRHVEAGHVPTPLEQLKINREMIVLKDDPNGGVIYEEHIEVIRRTYTGTALAITYSPSFSPGANAYYVPASPQDNSAAEALHGLIGPLLGGKK